MNTTTPKENPMDPIRKLVSDVLRIDYDDVNDTLSYHSVSEWSSLAHVELMIAMEHRFGVDIDSVAVCKLTSLAAIRAFLSSALKGLSGGSAAISCYPTTPKVGVARGLDGITIDNTNITHIDSLNGNLLYRGYSIHDLVVYSNYEETAYLLLQGELPEQEQLELFRSELRSARALPIPVITFVRDLRMAHPMDTLRSVASLLAVYDSERNQNDLPATYRKGLRLVSQLATALAEHRRARLGLEAAPVNIGLPHVQAFLQAFCGERLGAQELEVVERNFILHADHSSNASAFAARVAVGTNADVHSAFTAAIATFSGPLHGGAIEQVMRVVHEIGTPDKAESYVQSQRARGEPVMGFGHRLYRTEDPRARHMRDGARLLSERHDAAQLYEILEAVREAMRPLAKHGVNVNVDFYAGIVYHMLGIEPEYFPALFVLGRSVGWLAHILEQLHANILIRPQLNYQGAMARPWVPLHQRTGTSESPTRADSN